MKIEEIKKLIIKGEGISLEFKEARESLPESFFETVCAFLNRNGGSILLGVSDSGKYIGVSPGRVETICKQLADISNNPSKITPAFLLHPEIIDYRGQKLISVLVPASSQVHRCNGKVFDRSVDGDFEVKADEAIKNIYLRKSSLYTETTIYPYLHESDFVDGIVDKVRKLIQINRPNHP